MKNFKKSKQGLLYMFFLTALLAGLFSACEKAVAAKENPELMKVYGESEAEMTAPPMVPKPVGKRAAGKLIVNMEVVEK